MPELPAGAERYRKAPEPPSKALSAAQRDIDLANTQVRIQSVLADYFHITVPSELTRSWKTWCPFSGEHYDGGLEKNMRVYPGNHAYCFALHGRLTPVKMLMIRSEVGAQRAAQRLIAAYGLRKDEPYWERMHNLVLEKEQRSSEVGSTIDAVQALQAALQATPGYPDRQFDADVLQAMETWLEKLDELTQAKIEGGLRTWFRSALEQITKVVERP